MNFGSEIESDAKTNCSSCALKDRCKDPRKSKRWCCTFFQEIVKSNDDESSKDFQKWMRQLVKSESVLSDPYAVDDRDCALAPNFYTWCISDKFLHHKPTPFPWQIQVGMKLFGDGCYACSDPEWYDDIPFDCDPYDIPKYIALRKNGRCPRCGKTVIDGLRAGRENDVNTFIGVVGQRCITGDTLLLTDRGLVRIGDWAPKNTTVGWQGRNWHSKWCKNSLKVVLESGEIKRVSDFWVSAPENIRIVMLANGQIIRGTNDHPIKTIDGWVCLNRLKIGTLVPIFYNQNIWGQSSELNLKTARELGLKNGWFKSIPRKVTESSKEIVCAFLQGWFDAASCVDDCISISICSRELTTQVQSILLNLGIVSNVEFTNNPQWKLSIHASMLEVFRTNIGFLSSFKIKSLEKIIYKTPIDFLPTENVFWTSVTKNILSKTKHVTYDLNVPKHHRFIANGLLNHNSGKCVDGSALVPTNRGIIPLRDVVVGDYALVRGKLWPVTATYITKKKPVVKLVTRRGYTLSLTPEHLVQTPTGWVRADKAKYVLVRRESPFRLGMPAWRRRRLKQKLHGLRSTAFNAPEQVATKLMRDFVQHEDAFQTSLVLTIVSGMGADFQQALLVWGIMSVRDVNHPDTVVIGQPWATRYFKQIGIKTRRIAVFVWLGRKLGVRKLPPPTCEQLVVKIANLIASYKKSNDLIDTALNMLVDPAQLRFAQEMQSSAINKTLTREMAAQYAALVRHMPIRDVIAHRELENALTDAARSDSSWEVVQSCKLDGKKDVYDIEVPGIHCFVANGIEVHNSTGTSLLLSYQLHRLLKLKNPSEFYGIRRNSVLRTSVVGISYANAKAFVWSPFLDAITGSPWFELYHKILDETAKKRGEDELFKLKDSFLMYRNAALYLSPQSPDKRALRGATRIGMVVDELGHFSENIKLIRASGLEIWTSLFNSLTDVRIATKKLRRQGVLSIPPAIAIAISSPRDVADPILSLRERFTKPGIKNAYTMLKETWNARPDYTRQVLVDEGIDEQTIDRDFGCRPPFSLNPFFANIDPIKDVVGNYKSMISQKTVASTGTKRRSLSAKLTWRGPDDTVPKVLGLDAGHNKNAFSLAVAHFDELGKVCYDAFVEVRPRTNLPVNFEAVYEEVIAPLIQKLGIKILASDRWQQYAISDRAEKDFGVIAVEKRLVYGDFLAFRDTILNRGATIPRPEIGWKEILNVETEEIRAFDDKPVAQFARQCIRVVDVPGKTVDKPTTGNDDVFRAAVIAHYAMNQPAVAAVLKSGKLNRRGGAIAAAATGSSVLTVSKPTLGVIGGTVFIKPKGDK